jgi:hypothetical protein
LQKAQLASVNIGHRGQHSTEKENTNFSAEFAPGGLIDEASAKPTRKLRWRSDNFSPTIAELTH